MYFEDNGQFTILDYILFVIVLVMSAGIGLYYAIKSRKAITTVDDYLLGGRNMGLLPISCSLIATSLSATAIVSLPAEAYAYGTYLWIYIYCIVIMGIFTSWLFLPIFIDLKITSIFEYFELRFSREVKLIASALYMLSGIVFLSYVVYIPAVTFQRVSGVDTYVTIIVLSTISAIYTALGGFKAVVWTDVVQLIFMFTSVTIVITVGIYSVGGIDKVLDAAHRGGRLVFVNSEVVNSRSSIWGHITSSTLLSIYHYGLNQANIQRYMALSNVRRMKISIFILVIAYCIYTITSPILGIIMYANYETCDPYTAGIIQKIDQISPHFILEKASLFNGFSGIFIAGIFSASLSTTSSFLNTMSGIVYENFIRPRFPRITGNSVGRIMKGTVFVLCILQICLIFFIEQMGTIAKIGNQVKAVSACGLLSLFFLGIFFPKANNRGAQAGALASIACILTLIIGGSFSGKHEPTLPFRTDGCANQRNSTKLSITSFDNFANEDETFWFFRINFIYYGLICIFVGILVGYVVSLLTGGSTVTDQRLLVKFLQRKRHQDGEEEMNLKPINES